MSAKKPTAANHTDSDSVAAAQRRIAARLEELERAAAEGRLLEAVKDVPSIEDQLRPFLDGSSSEP